MLTRVLPEARRQTRMHLPRPRAGKGNSLPGLAVSRAPARAPGVCDIRRRLIRHTERWCALLLLCSSFAGAIAQSRDPRKWGPMPEPVLGESVADIDGSYAGELEVDVTALVGRQSSWASAVAIEARVLDWLGLEAEVEYSQAPAASEGEVELRVSGSVSFLHDFERGLHGQVEIGGRLTAEPEQGPNLGEPRAPISSGVRLGLDQRWWTLRLGLGVAFGSESAHAVPAWASATAFLNLGRDRWASLGLDGEADWTRRNPFTLAPTLLLDARTLRWPVRLAIVTPYGFAGGGAEAWFGLMVRLIGEFDIGGVD